MDSANVLQATQSCIWLHRYGLIAHTFMMSAKQKLQVMLTQTHEVCLNKYVNQPHTHWRQCCNTMYEHVINVISQTHLISSSHIILTNWNLKNPNSEVLILNNVQHQRQYAIFNKQLDSFKD